MDLATIDHFLQISFTLLNVLVSIFFCGLVFYYFVKRPAKRMPKHLKLYFLTCIVPWVGVMVAFSIIAGIYYLITSGYNDLTFKILRFILTISTQQIRLSYLFIIIGRIFSTLFYKSYAKHSSFSTTLFLIFLTYTASFINGIFEYYRLFVDLKAFAWILYVAIVTHIITLILCKALFSINKAKYKFLAYQSSLADRHQIYENVKILKILSPFIFSFSIIAPLGPLAVMNYKFIFGPLSPPGLFYLFYNVTFVIMVFWTLKMPNENVQRVNAIGQTSPQKLYVKNAAKIIAVDKYFDDLKLQWEK